MEDLIKFAKKYLIIFALTFAVSSYLAVRLHAWPMLFAVVPSGMGAWLCLCVALGKVRVCEEPKDEAEKKEDKKEASASRKPLTGHDIFIGIFSALCLISFVLFILFFRPGTFELSLCCGAVFVVTSVTLLMIGVNKMAKEPWWPWWPWFF